MDETNQKKKMLLIGIVITVAIFIVTLIVLLILMQQEGKKTKFQIKNKLYKSKSVYISLSADQVGEDAAGTYEQKEIIVDNQYTPITITTPDGKVYYNIETLTKLTGYKYNNGAYGEEIDETKDKCYIDNGGEYVTYLLDSNEITKNIKIVKQYTEELKIPYEKISNTTLSNTSSAELDKESFTLEQPVIQFEDFLYASKEAITKGLNMRILDNQGTIVDIQTLEDLVNGYSNSLSQSGYTLTPNFKNQRALSDGYAVVGKDKEYGVVDLETGKEVISLKYDSVEYVQSIGEFIVSSNSNYGMQKPGSQTPTIKLEYESIDLLNAEKKLYIVGKNGKYGVINSEGNEVIPTEYDQIGLTSVSAYKSQGEKDKYVINGECIPVMRNGNYGLYSIDGTLLASTRFSAIGCENPNEIIKNTSAMPTLTIPLSDKVTGIVFAMKNAAGTTVYGIITTNGTVVLNAYYTAIYYMQRNGNITYYFNKPANNELLTLKELLSTRETVKELIEQTKSRKEQADEEQREQEYLNRANQTDNQGDSSNSDSNNSSDNSDQNNSNNDNSSSDNNENNSNDNNDQNN
jgi:hypothetical protein